MGLSIETLSSAQTFGEALMFKGLKRTHRYAVLACVLAVKATWTLW